jgi:hypothetical protein
MSQIEDWNARTKILKRERIARDNAVKERRDENNYIRKFREPVESNDLEIKGGYLSTDPNSLFQSHCCP